MTTAWSAGPVPVPADGDEVTTSWLGQVLGYPVDVVGMERIGAEYGLASRLYRVWLAAGGGVVVKLWAADGRAGLREVFVLGSLGTRLGRHAPRCLGVAADVGAGRGAVVLDDLREARQGDVLDEIGADGVPLATALASLHAAAPGPEALAGSGWLGPTPWLACSAEWLSSGSDELARRFGPLPVVLDAFLADVGRHYAVAAERLALAPRTLVHDDMHLDNVLFDGVTGEPVVLDWARAAIGPGVLDLAELLLAARPVERRPMVGAYRDGLARVLIGGQGPRRGQRMCQPGRRRSKASARGRDSPSFPPAPSVRGGRRGSGRVPRTRSSRPIGAVST